uniref:Ig-like domain-containing protein n=1 Tax=Taenia asiatica TaxID=60517 RepID=A0A0R3W9S4_TAEAS
LYAASLSCSNYEGACRLYLDQKSVNIDHNLLKNCPNSCTRLSIISADSIGRTIDQSSFRNFTHLSSLSIHSNLTSVQDFAWLLYLKNLEHLDLSHCGLVSLNTAEFTTGFPSLQTVDLSCNNLETLYLPFLFDVPQLRYLNISWNRFRNFPDLSSGTLVVNIANNVLDCTCTNVQLNSQGNFLTSGFNCSLIACPYFLRFERTFSNLTLSLQVAESFQFSCNVNASNSVEFGVFSPIGFIRAPSWSPSANDTEIARYEYVVLPVQRPIRITVQRTSRTSFVTAVDYARGHHGGVWRCAALSNGGYLLDNQPYTVIIGTCIDQLFLTTTILGFIVMTITLILGLIIGSVRYLVETRCFRQSQSHKFFVRPLIGVIPVPSMQINKATSVKEISLNQRICPACLVKPAFLCGYCLSVHAFAKFEVLCSEKGIPAHPPPQHKHKGGQCLVDASTLLIAECSSTLDQRINDDEEGCIEAIGDDDGSKIQDEVRRIPHENVLNYGFPSEFCHCYHLDMRFTDDGETRTSAALRDVKLIFRDEQLAQEYTEVLEVLQAAAKSNDAVTFRERLEEFRGRLVRDVGARVRVAREEIVALKERSAKSVARLRGQSGAVAQFMKAGFSQVRDGMRTVAEMCTGGGGACDDSTTGLVTIGQSISVVSIYKDEMTRKSKERCVSSFTF